MKTGVPDLTKQFEDWRSMLLDTSKRNRLINCKFTGGGAIELVHPELAAAWKTLVVDGSAMVFQNTGPLLDDATDYAEAPPLPGLAAEDGEAISEAAERNSLSPSQIERRRQSGDLLANAVLTRSSDRAIAARLKRLSVAAATSLSEQGVNSLFVGLGFLKWFESPDSDVPILSPLVLVPVTLGQKTVDAHWELSPLGDEPIPNHPLAEILKSEFRLRLPTFSDETISESAMELERFFEQVKANVPARWSIERTVVLGTFAFQKIAMWHDLRENQAVIQNNPICRGLAGDDSAMQVSSDSAVTGKDLDHVTPLEAHHLIVDCDSSQLAAIHAVKQGKNLILDGPPGTGKSQTIANIIAECLATSKTVLFVSEKAAALEVVKRRLDKANLGDFCLECHSHKVNKKHVIDELGKCLTRGGEKYRSMEQDLAELRRRRDKLNEYTRALHRPQSKLEATAFEVHGKLAQIRVPTSTRTIISNPFCIDQNAFSQLCEAVSRLASCRSIIANKGMRPWRGMNVERYSLTIVDDIRFHFTRAAETLGARLRPTNELAQLGYLSGNPTLADLEAALISSEAVLKLPAIPSAWVERGLSATAERYRTLHQHVASYRILMSGLSAYRGDSVDRAASEAFVSAKETAATDLMLKTSQRTVRSRANSFRMAKDSITALISSLTQLHARQGSLLAEVGMKTSPESTAADAENLARHLAIVAASKDIHSDWFDSTNLQRLRRVAVSASEIATMAIATRDSLNASMLPIAFMDVALDQIDAILRHRSWFGRWGASWRRAKQAFVALYRPASSPTSARKLLDDAYHLKRFHIFRRGLAQSIGTEAVAIGWNGDVDFAWDSLIRQLDAIEALPADLRAALGVHLGPSRKLDGAHLALMSAEMSRACERFCRAASDLASVVDLERAFGIGDLSMAPLANISAEAAAHRERFQSGHTSLAEILQSLEADKDVDATGLLDDYSVLVEARTLRSQAIELCGQLGETIQQTSTREICNVAEQAALAEWALDFLRMYGGAPPQHVMRILTEPDIRAKVLQLTTESRRADRPEGAESLSFARSLFEGSGISATGVDVGALPIVELKRWLDERVRDADQVSEWVAFIAACANMERLGLATLRDEILSQAVPVESAIDVFKQRFYRLWLDEAYRAEPALRGFDIVEHTDNLLSFRRLDKSWINNGFVRVRQRVLAASPRVAGLDVDAPENSEVGILLREANKKRRHLPLRKLFAAMPTLLLKLKPCVMMSPLSVSTFFSQREMRFDVVIFDEASQVRPHDAVCAIYRGDQLVLAGDQKQLPPTNFFERLGEDVSAEDQEDGGQDVRDFESILDACSSLRFPRQRLKWHYRSRRESLIAFSNRHFYDNELITFPSVKDVDGSSGVEFTRVEGGCWSGRSEGGVNAAEATAVARAVIEHSRKNPHLTLGVITMNQPQQMRVLDEISSARKGNPDLDPFFSLENQEPFFVKNLENVQGDERDVIFLGIGYAKNSSGVLHHNFGPLNKPGGERRLNVAVTRARIKLRVFASIVAQDIDLSRTQAIGAKLLRAYLEFAERGPKALGEEVTGDSERDFDSDFEREVARALTDRGLDVRRQIGCSGYRIDLAITHPAQSGRYVLGIECDGATYHSFATARERDRLRQEVLEGLGCRICRIWSTDWIRDPRRQIERVMNEYRDSLAFGDARAIPHDTDDKISVEREDDRRSGVAPPTYADIDEVGSAEIGVVVRACLEMYGATPLEDVLQHTSKTLGFQRLGSRIKARLSEEIKRLIARETVALGADQRLRLPSSEPKSRDT